MCFSYKYFCIFGRRIVKVFSQSDVVGYFRATENWKMKEDYIKRINNIFLFIDENLDQELNLEMVKHNLLQYVVGSFIFATLLAISFGFTFFYLLNLFRKESTS